MYYFSLKWFKSSFFWFKILDIISSLEMGHEKLKKHSVDIDNSVTVVDASILMPTQL